MKIAVGGKNLDCIVGGDSNVVFGGEVNIFPSTPFVISKDYKRPRKNGRVVSPTDVAGEIAKKYLKSLPQDYLDAMSGVVVSRIRRLEISPPCREDEDWVNAIVQYHAIVQGYGPIPTE